ncbi:hypothetical protein TBLA_0B05060 [Henningerozyma blattae CBS 6284]|uniref:Biogenesis of lysosome-related organelles complex 1 subunit KXD1 n=1 Tax=Henningerozyma blattae (strain ATCC 34711 / CBS 6284 / DSM 70876 / NBRC 10599 / NRRL Y-10934 / UCD 77-7) TaxID=1071380 RepID=I2GYY8_HENB6|nr:hypothetical protein TBLA_0B05060 [Tetrapisispora blattae CBS 6284]CCH59340.1 hypothetical protein TBLA_0B05060 [Tetrapisispora blattae CBS 6284]
MVQNSTEGNQSHLTSHTQSQLRAPGIPSHNYVVESNLNEDLLDEDIDQSSISGAENEEEIEDHHTTNLMNNEDNYGNDDDDDDDDYIFGLDNGDISTENNHALSETLTSQTRDNSNLHTIDVAEYIKSTLLTSLDNPDTFATALSLQARTSAIINTKSLQLQQLINESTDILKRLKTRYANGIIISNRINKNLIYCRKKIDLLSNNLRLNYTIEFNNAREKILERKLTGDNDTALASVQFDNDEI